MGQRSNFQHGPMEMKFNMDDPYGILSMLKYFEGHSRSLRGHYDVTFGLMQNAPIELKFDMNDP